MNQEATAIFLQRKKDICEDPDFFDREACRLPRALNATQLRIQLSVGCWLLPVLPSLSLSLSLSGAVGVHGGGWGVE